MEFCFRIAFSNTIHVMQILLLCFCHCLVLPITLDFSILKLENIQKHEVMMTLIAIYKQFSQKEMLGNLVEKLLRSSVELPLAFVSEIMSHNFWQQKPVGFRCSNVVTWVMNLCHLQSTLLPSRDSNLCLTDNCTCLQLFHEN